jgi:PAS domain S-box-containing protein
MRSLQASERQYRAVVDHATDALFVHGDQGRIIDVNQQACESLGYTRDELLGMSPTEFDPDVTPEFLAALGPKIRAGGTVAFDSRHRRKDGTLFPVEVRLRSFVLGERTLAVALARDISERKRAEQALRASEERFRELAETIAEVFWVTNAEKSAMLYISPAYERIWGRTCQSLYDAPQSWLDAIHPDDRARVLDAALTKQEAGLYDEEYRIVRPDGEARWIRDVAFPVRDATGRVARVVGVARDITDRRSLEMQLRHSQKMDAIGQLAGGVAHDFNNLLGAILLDADHADGMPHHPDEVREAVADIRAAAERAAALTRQLLLFGRRQALQARSLDLNAIVRDLTKMLQRIIGEDIRLDVRLSAMQLAVHADAGMLEQVLVNLVVNARDAMPNGGTLTIATTEQIFDGLGASRVLDAQPGRYACLTVTDTGAGIAPEILPRIFEPFFTTKEPGRGTGLGLATAFGIVKEHRGWIAVDSATGRGTTFEVFVPIQGDASDTRARAVTTSPGGSETIFFVEDEPQLRRATRRILERHGYRVIEADNGADAMRMWPDIRQAVSLLLTDVVMPGGIDGFELASRLRADRPELAVIFASGYPPDAQQPERPLQKPVPSAQLLETIRRSLDRRV